MELDAKELQFEITNEECAYLDQLLRQPGWQVVLKIMDGYVAALTVGAVNASLQEPLGNADRIASAWAYAVIGKALRVATENGLTFEVQRWRRGEQLDPEALAEQRRLKHTLEAI